MTKDEDPEFAQCSLDSCWSLLHCGQSEVLPVGDHWVVTGPIWFFFFLMEGVTLLPPTGVLGSVSSSLEVWVLHSLCQTHIALLSCPFSRSKHKLLYLLAIFDPWESEYYIQFTYLSFFHWTSMHIAYHVLGHQAKSKKSPHTHTYPRCSQFSQIHFFVSICLSTNSHPRSNTHSLKLRLAVYFFHRFQLLFFPPPQAILPDNSKVQ